MKSLLLLLALTLSPALSQAEPTVNNAPVSPADRTLAFDQTRTLEGTFNAKGISELEIKSSFGQVNIEYTDQKTISYTAEVHIATNDEAYGRALLEGTRIDYSTEGNEATLRTIYGDEGTVSNSRSFTRRVELTVTMPRKMKLEAKLKYAGILLPKSNVGSVDLAVKYGNIVGGNFTGLLRINNKYGNIKLGTVVEAEIEAEYDSDVRLDSAEKLSIEADYSNLTLGTVDNLQLKAKYGAAKIGSLAKGSIKSSYTNIDIDVLNKSLTDCRMSYGHLNIDNFQATVSAFDLTANFGDINLKVDPKANFVIDARNFGACKAPGFDVKNSNDYAVRRNYVITVGKGGKTFQLDGREYSGLSVEKR